MAQMPKEVMDAFNDPAASKWLATVNPKEVKPNAVTISTLMSKDNETLVFAHLFMEKTKANLDANKKVSVLAFKPPLTCYRVTGTFQEWQRSGPFYETFRDSVFKKMPVQAQGVGLIKVEEIFSCSPLEGTKKIV